MAYVNVAEWKAEQVTEWLKGLDSSILPYLQLFLNNEIGGQQLLNVRPEDLELLGIKRLGHQELILEAVEHLRNFHYELDRENLQLLALRLSCQAHSLHNELRRHTDSQPVSTQTLADVASVVRAVKPLVCWLDRSPFSGQLEYADRKSELLRCSLEIATCAQRDRFAERPVEEIRASCGTLAKIADGIIQDIADPLILQPASLDLATLRKRGGDDLGFFIVPSFHGVHQIGEIKFGSPAHQCGKVEEGDEVVQVNYQTVVGWQRKKVIALFEESLSDVFLTLKKRPRHTKVYGQIYMKPYRLPSKKRAPAYTRWHENLPSPRPELLTIPDFEMPLPRSVPKSPPSKHASIEPLSNVILCTSSESDDNGSGCDEASLDYELEGHASPTSMRLYLPKPRVSVQRRATITGASPTSHRPPIDLEKFLRELKLEKKWKGSGHSQDSDGDFKILRNKSPIEQTERPSTCLGFEKSTHKLYLRNKKSSSSSEVGFSVGSENGDKIQDSIATFEKLSELSGCSTPTVQNPQEALSANSVSNEEQKEKRFVSRLEIVVDCSDSRIEFSPQSQRLEVDKENFNGPLPLAIASFLDGSYEEPNSIQSSEKTRKISSESQVGDLPNSCRERGRLDKSFSTPAYDLSGIEGFEVNVSKDRKRTNPCIAPEMKNNVDIKWLPSTNEIPSPDSSNAHSNSTSFPTTCAFSSTPICQEDSVHPVFKFPSSLHIGPKDDVLLNDFGCDLNSNPVAHGRVVETINRHLLDSNHQGDDDDDDFDSASESFGVHENLGVKPRTCLDSSFDVDFQNGNNVSGEKLTKFDNCCQKFDCNQNTADTKLPPKKPPRIVTNPSLLDHPTRDTDVTLESLKPKDLSLDSRGGATVPLVRLYSTMECTDKSPLHTQPKTLSKLSLTPPDPPPRPVPPSRSPSTPTDPSKPSPLRAIISSRSGASKPSLNSPKITSKKNPFLARRRVVGVKELGIADYQGWLYRRLRVGGSGAQWIKGWFILKGTTFYGFKSREACRADCFISLPGFTISPAEEVKSKKYAFKVYHTGTVFYFAAESDEELAAWLDCLSVATLALDLNTLKASFSEGRPEDKSTNNGAVFSETEDEGDEPEAVDSCFPSPKMRKFTNFLSGHSSTPMHTTSPKPARSHQNLALSGDSKAYDIQKKFGSLKKLGYKSKPHPSSSASSISGSDQGQDVPLVSAPHSLDRKYLRFLSSSKNQNVPVPTAQFRSYRRVAASDSCQAMPGALKLPEGTPNRCFKTDGTDQQNVPGDCMPPSLRFLNGPSSDLDLRRSGRGVGVSSHTEDISGLLTLEQFMLLRQEEERLQNQHTIHTAPTRDRSRDVRERDTSTREPHEAYAGYTEDPVSSLKQSLERHRTPSSSATRPIPATRTLLKVGDHTVERPVVAPRNLRVSSDTHGCRESASNSLATHSNESPIEVPPTSKQPRLKNAALYQPPPVAFPSSPNLGPSFEMHLDNQGSTLSVEDQMSRAKSTGSKLRQLFSPKHSHPIVSQSQVPSSHRPDMVHSTVGSSTPRTLLGSPRLHRALFRHGESRKAKVSPPSDSLVNAPVAASERRSSSPPPNSSSDWIHEFSPSPKPTMGIAMIGKKTSPLTSTVNNINTVPVPCPPVIPPDYPGLEYPPVFEPGTYSLSDTSSLLCQPSQTNSSVQLSNSDHSVSHFPH